MQKLRILFITAFYPPHGVGGWEQLVRDINERLKTRGHTTQVLASDFGVDETTGSDKVLRTLTLESDIYHYQPLRFWGHKRRLQANLTRVKQTIEAFRPDIIFIHVMWNLSRGIAWVAEQARPGQVLYYIANDWPQATDPHTAYWQSTPNNRWIRPLFRLLAQWPLAVVKQEQQRFALKFEHVLCVSKAVKAQLEREAGIPAGQMTVVYNGVETELFKPKDGRRKTEDGLRLLYAGSLVKHKGVHTTIEAVAKVEGVYLTIVGAGHPAYEEKLRELVKWLGVSGRVTFKPKVPREAMPDLLRQFDVLLFPSIWQEPLARMMQEAMATGLVVIGTLTGGSGELLVEGETGLTFPAGDSHALTQQIKRLANDPVLYQTLAQQGRDKVQAQFDLERMIDEIEAYSIQMLAN